MADIFLSYSRADRPVAQTMAEALEAEGFSVWWDKVLRAGQTYDEVTETMLRDAQVVIVLWSETSVQSKWVRAEATLGQRKCELVPVMIEDAERPIMFELIQTADLIGWSGDRSEARWKEFIADVQRSLEKARSGAEETPRPAPKSKEQPKSKEKSKSKPVAAAPAPAASEPPKTPKKKKSSGGLPLLLGGLIVVGGGAWYGLKFVNGDGISTTTETTKIAEVTAPECDVCPEMVRMAGGATLLGSADDERGRSGNEGPQIEVSIAPFWIGKTEITRAEWQVCVEDGACRPAQSSGEVDHPITGINWSDASGYAEWLSGKSDHVFRLPSEAEWEYAARAGTETLFWWGDQYPGPGVVQGEARAVSALPENGFGVSGMLGNVREWVADCYVNSHANAPSDGRAVTNGDCGRRVVKGGSFRLNAGEHRPANRARYQQSVRDRSLGFRVVAEAK